MRAICSSLLEWSAVLIFMEEGEGREKRLGTKSTDNNTSVPPSIAFGSTSEPGHRCPKGHNAHSHKLFNMHGARGRELTHSPAPFTILSPRAGRAGGGG